MKEKIITGIIVFFVMICNSLAVDCGGKGNTFTLNDITFKISDASKCIYKTDDGRELRFENDKWTYTNTKGNTITETDLTKIKPSDIRTTGTSGDFEGRVAGSNYVLTNKDDPSKYVSIPFFLMGDIGDPNTINGNFNEDGSFTFTLDHRAGKFGKGDWTITRGEDGSNTYSRGGDTRFVIHETGGGGIYVMDSEKTGSQTIYDGHGNELYYCNKMLSFGACDTLGPCSSGETENCYGTGNDAVSYTHLTLPTIYSV